MRWNTFVSYYDYYQPGSLVCQAPIPFIEKDASVNEHIEQNASISATKALLERKDVIVVSSVSAIYGLE